MGELRDTGSAPAYVWVDPGAVPYGDTGLTFGDMFPHQYRARLVPKAEFIEQFPTDSILSHFDPAEPIEILGPKLDAYAQQKAASESPGFEWTPYVQDCDLEGWEFEIIARDYELCTPILAETKVQSLYGSCRSDDTPEFVPIYGFTYTCQGQQVEEIHEGVPSEYFGGPSRIQVNYVFPYQFSIFQLGAGDWRKVNCGTPYKPDDLPVPVPPPPPPTIPPNIPPPPPPPRAPLVGNISIDEFSPDDPPPGGSYVEREPPTAENPFENWIFHIPDPCEECPPEAKKIPKVPPGTPPGYVPRVGEDGLPTWEAPTGGGEVVFVSKMLKRMWRNPATGLDEPREIEVFVPGTVDGDNMVSLYNELFLMIQEASRGQGRAYVRKQIDVEASPSNEGVA